MSHDTKVALAGDIDIAAREDPGLLRRLVAEYLRLRDRHNALTRRRGELSKELLPLLEAAGGSYTATRKALEVYVDESDRFDYDAQALHGLVDLGLVTEDEFARALETVVVKAVLEGWVKRGLVTELDIARTGGQVVREVVRQIRVRKLQEAKGKK